MDLHYEKAMKKWLDPDNMVLSRVMEDAAYEDSKSSIYRGGH